MNEQVFAKIHIKKVREEAIKNYEISIFYKVFSEEEYRSIADIQDPTEKKEILKYVHRLQFKEIDKNKCMYFNTETFRTRAGKYLTATEVETGYSVATKFQDVHITRVPKIILEMKGVFGDSLTVVVEKIV